MSSTRSEVFDVRGLRFASEKNVVVANPTAQTATVTFDPANATIDDLRSWIRECGYHCAGLSVPNHVCEPGPVTMPREDTTATPEQTNPVMPTCGSCS
jgi:Cu2+-exporting ATPase